jgi:predicted HTH transcriptional regulator
MKPADVKKLNYIKDLIHSGEGQNLDFKFEINDAKKLARTFSAFSNTSGGKLLIGVKDNGKISGIQSDEEEYMVESAAHLYSKPGINYSVKKWFIEGKCILEVNIPESNKRPHLAPDEKGIWKAYVRVQDQNMKANRVLVSVWKNSNRKKGAFISFNKEEMALLDYLDHNGEISFSRFMKTARISPRQAEKILVNLILMDALEMVITKKSTFFRRKNDTNQL